MDKAEQELIRRIASVVGHELRNPMAVINNSAYFVKAKLGGGSLDPKVKKHLKIIEAEISRADRLIGDMLAYSRPAQPLAETKPMDALVGDALKSYARPAGGKLEFKPGAKGARVSADPQMLAEALRRLLDNAFEAMGGEGAAQVVTGLSKDGVFVAVSDAGPGVDAQVKDSLLEPFVTTKPRGLGLGLSLARKRIEANGGSLSFQSGPKGATFRLTLPTV